MRTSNLSSANDANKPQGLSPTTKLLPAISVARAQHLNTTCAFDRLTDHYARTLKLGHAHARFTVQFLHAMDLKRACAATGIGYETGRTYIKKLFEVTSSKSQLELMAILISLKPN